MKSGSASKTSDFVAAIRATYHYRPEKVVFDDDKAEELTSFYFRMMLKIPPLRKRVMENYYLSRMGSSLGVMVRARYAEDKFNAAIQRGIQQYIILGAGLDSFILRNHPAADQISVFELDHPDTQSVKQQRMKSRGLDPKMITHFLPIDFTTQTIADVLKDSALDFSKPVFVSWLGVTYYLGYDNITLTLRSLADILAPGSELVMDYNDARLYDDEYLDQNPELGARVRYFFKFVADKGEPMLSGFDPAKLNDFIIPTGWTLQETVVSGEEIKKFLQGTPDITWPSEYDHLAHLILSSDHGTLQNNQNQADHIEGAS